LTWTTLTGCSGPWPEPAAAMQPDRATQPDPLLYAGLVACRACGERGHPVDAMWLTDDLIVATFAPPCPHADRFVTMVVTPRELRPLDIEPGGQCERTWCQATARTGQPCAKRAMRGSQFCAWHHHHQHQERA
jgi:hypothetical protein